MKGLQLGPGVEVAAEPGNPFAKEEELAKQKGADAALGVISGFFATLHLIVFFLLCLPLLIGIAYGAVIIYGAVQVQNLKSRTWGIVSGIMVMIPIHAVGFMIITLTLALLLLAFVYDDPFLIKAFIIIIGVIELAWGVSLGIWNIKTLMDPKVVAGFEYIEDQD
jgi:hypothetical protein